VRGKMVITTTLWEDDPMTKTLAYLIVGLFLALLLLVGVAAAQTCTQTVRCSGSVCWVETRCY